jgi:sialic acid synthase
MPVKLIAEIGNTHLGDMDRAKKLCKLASASDAYCVKTQKRDPDSSTPENIKNLPHPNPHFAYGPTYLDHRKNLELTIDQHKELFDYCQMLGIKYTSSVWDLISAKEIATLNPEFIKIPSATNNDFETLNWLFENYGGEVHISTGMTTDKEKQELIDVIVNSGRGKDVILYHTTSGYPVPFEESCMLEIEKLRRNYGSIVKSIGFSNHCLGIALDIVAVCLEVSHIERHFIDDRTVRHTDAAASLEPGAFMKLVRDVRVAESSMSYKPQEIMPCEMANREKLRKIHD